MKKGNFIIGFKKSIFFVIPFLITSCGGGVTLKATDGSEVYFKSENVTCEWGELYTPMSRKKYRNLWCRANGVRTFLNGATENYSRGEVCRRKYLNGEEEYPYQKTFPCAAARELGKY